jgi:TonB family protein
MRRTIPTILMAVLGGCLPANMPMQGPTLLPESFPPYGVGFRRYEAPQFPYKLRALGVSTGYAVVVVTVGSNGTVLDAVGIEASDAEFVNAVTELAPNWVFAPADSETLPRREVLQYRFRLSGVVSTRTHREAALEGFVDSNDDFPRVRTVPYSDLDMPPVRIDAGASAPRPPVEGHAELSFVIDQAGRVRVPVVLEASETAIGLAALSEVRDWRFSPPQQAGQSVLVEVRARWGDR